MMVELDEDGSGSIDFSEFLAMVGGQKTRAAEADDESDMLSAFVACGGNADKTGNVIGDKLVRIIKDDFGLPLDIEAMLVQMDADGSGLVDYEEFCGLFGGAAISLELKGSSLGDDEATEDDASWR